MDRMAVQQEQPPARPSERERQDEVEARSRSLRNGLISLAIFFVLLVALLLAVPGLRSAADFISDANIGWVLLGIGLEVLSCAGYVVVFHLVFAELSERLTVRLSLSELAMNSVVSVSGLAGLALGAWVLATRGVAAKRIARGTVLLFVLTSVVNVAGVVLIGIPMWLGLLPGSEDELLTLLPALLAIVLIVVTLALAGWARWATAYSTSSRCTRACARSGT